MAHASWLFLLFSLLNAAWVALHLARGSDRLLQIGASVGLLWLCWWWLTGHRRARFPTRGLVPESLSLLLIGASVGDPVRAVGLFHVGLSFRALYGSVWHVALATVLYLGAWISAVALGSPVDLAGLVSDASLNQAAGFATAAGLGYVLASLLARHERSTTRVNALAQTGASLVRVTALEDIYRGAIEGARRLLEPTDAGRIVVAVGVSDRFLVVDSMGDRADEVRGRRIDLRHLSDDVLARLMERRPFATTGRQATDFHRALSFEPKSGPVVVVPLVVRDALGGIILAELEAVPDPWPAEELELFATQVGRALDNAEAVEEIRRGERRFRSMVQASSDVITVVDPEGKIRYQSPSIERVFGYPPDQVLGIDFGELVHSEDRSRVMAVLQEARDQSGILPPVDARIRHQEGTWVHAEIIANSLLNDPNVLGVVLTSRDINDRKTLAEQLAHQAFHDPLTNLPNRALFRDRLEHALSRSISRQGSIAVMFLDLDNFKVINDSLGHEIGDRLLVAAAGRIESCVRPQDTVGRLGGDEFTVLLEDVASPSDAITIASRIAERLRAPFTLGGHEVFTSASIGIALSGPGHDKPEYILRDADVAMYRAKSAGKSRFEVFDSSMGIHAWERMALETGLRQAIERNEFRVFFQPVVDLGTGLISEMEALVRWQHPARGMVSPSVFIPLAEETGLIVPIGIWTLEEACRQTREWQLRYPSERPIVVGVNLASKQLQNPDLVEQICRILFETGLEPPSLKLEITESAAMEDVEGTIATLQKLKTLGVRLAIDDFGTGYSSLSYLKRFSADTLKIDRSFVMGFGRNADDTAIVHAVIAFAKTLGLSITAEGIETRQQMELLRAAGCERGQGYYFAKPLPRDELNALFSGAGTTAALPTTTRAPASPDQSSVASPTAA